MHMKKTNCSDYPKQHFMKKILLTISFLAAIGWAGAQDNIYPAPAQANPIYIIGGTVHVGNGTVLEKAIVQIENGKIVRVGKDIPVPKTANVQVVNADGQHVYPGLILASTDLGLREISGSVRGTNDYRELGDLNPNVRAIAAYNTESEFINPLRTYGILLANVIPQGSLVMGTSSVVQLDAYNFEDAAYLADNGMHISLPSFIQRRGRRGGFGGPSAGNSNPAEAAQERINVIKKYFNDARSYFTETVHPNGKNLKLEAARPLFDKKQKLFVHANEVKQMLVAIDFVKQYGFDVVIVGGTESWQIADLLKANNIAVILNNTHNLPTMEDDDVDQPYKTPAVLQKAGVLFALNDNHVNSRYKNLPFNAGTAAAYGLNREEALSAITLNAAKILGVQDKTGSIEAGKDANIVISKGDILDMDGNVVTGAFIQGRKIVLESKQEQLADKYKHKYNVK